MQGQCLGTDRHGRGIPRNLIESYKWMSIAAARGDERAKGDMPILAGRMTAQEIEEAK